jgi:hypothetical protein
MKRYKVNKWVRGWGWIIIGITPIKEQAEQACKAGRKLGYTMRFVEICDE